MDECPGAQARVGNLALLHDIARCLERFGARGELPVLDVEHPARGEQMRQLCGVAVRIDQSHGFGETFERLFPLSFGGIRGGEIPEERGPLRALRLLPEGSRGLVPDSGPVVPLRCGLRRQTVENATFRARDGLVADEIVEASAKACRDDLQRAKRGTNEAGFDLTDEALGKFVAGKLRLAHAQRVASGADALAQSHRLLNCFWQTRHRRSPV